MVLYIIYSICFLDIISMALLLPIAHVHIISMGGTRFLVGLLASIQALLQLLTGPLVGSWSDTKGRKKLLINSLIMCLVSNLLLTFTNLNSYILSRVLFGVSCHVQILMRALIADVVPKENQNEVYAKMGAIIGLSFIIGPILGGIIGDFFYIAAILTTSTIISLGFVTFLPHDEIKAPNEKKSSVLQELGGVFLNLRSINWNVFWDVFLFKFLVESCFSSFYSSFGIILMEEFGASQQHVAFIISFFSLTGVFANLSIDSIKRFFFVDDHKGFKRNLYGFFGITITFTLLYLGASFWMFVFIVMPLAFLKTILDTTWTEMLINRTTETDKGTIMGSFESVFQMAGLATPLLTGYAGDTWGYSASLLINICPVALGTLVANYCFNKNVLINEKKD